MDDEQQIRELISTWLAATNARDVDTVLSLMTDDAVFLAPGRSVMRRKDFAAVARAQASPSAPAIDATADIQELQVHGDWAFAWTALEVVVTPTGGTPVRRAGYTLTLFRREAGRWRLARDANLLGGAGS